MGDKMSRNRLYKTGLEITFPRFLINPMELVFIFFETKIGSNRTKFTIIFGVLIIYLHSRRKGCFHTKLVIFYNI